MTDRPRPIAVRAYARLLRLLPRSVRRSDADEMSEAFEQLWNEPSDRWRRVVLAARLFGRLPGVIVLEWIDELRHESSGGGVMRGWGRNCHYAARTLGRAPTFTLTTVGLIGLGVGAVTTIFTIVDHVLLRPLPYPDAERLVTVRNGSYSGISYRAFQELGSVEAWAAGYSEDANLTGEGDPIRVEQALVSRGFFPMLGARPARGRLLVESDYGAPDVGVVSHTTWVDVFGADPELVGRTLRVDDEPVQIVGVLDERFEPPLNVTGPDVDLWRPIDWSTEVLNRPDYFVVEVVGRLTPGASLNDLQTELDALSLRLGDQYPEAMLDADGVPQEMPAAGLQDATTQRVRTGLRLLLGAVGLVLLVACLNVAHLFLARGLGRAREIAVRRVLGAGTGSLAQQLLVESLFVGLAGGILGFAVAILGVGGYVSLDPSLLPRSSSVAVDGRMLAFAGSLAIATTVLFGLVPALRTVRGDLTDELKGASRSSTSSQGTRRMRSALVVAEVAVSLVLIAQAGLLLRSFVKVQAVEPGFEVEGIWTLPLTPTGFEDPQAYVAAMDEIKEALAGLPGVASATYGLTVPFEFTGGRRCCWSQSRPTVEGEERSDLRIMLHPVTREYFETLRLPVLRGSVWSRAEEARTPVPVVLSQQLAIDLFGSAETALGRVVGDPDRMELSVVGVSKDTKHYGLDQPTPTSAYVPVSVVPFVIARAHMIVRLRGEAPAGLARTLREAVWTAAPDLPVPTVRPMRDWLEDSMAARRFDSALFGAFGVVALLLATAGLYGTLLYTVRQQSRELGIRLALGAARSRVQRDVVARGIFLAFLGSAVGVVLSWRAVRLLEGRLYEVEAADPMVLGGAVVALLTVAALASWIPARRAGRTDPLRTLQTE
jgi:putative ABC transport system permease protein